MLYVQKAKVLIQLKDYTQAITIYQLALDSLHQQIDLNKAKKLLLSNHDESNDISLVTEEEEAPKAPETAEERFKR